MNIARKNLTWLSAVSITIILFITFIAWTNLFYDHYQVFNFGWSDKEPINSNQRFNKVAYLDKHKGEFNAFLIGSSRMGHFPVEYAESLAGEGTSFYNLSLFSGIPADYLKILKYLNETGHPLDEVIVGLDLYPFFLPPDLSKPNFRHHPHVTGKRHFEFLLDYLFQTSFVYLATEMSYFFGETPAVYSHDYSTGRYYPERAIASINEDAPAYWRKELKKAAKGLKAFKATDHFLHKQQTADFKALVAWLKVNGIKFKVFIHPRHPANNAYYQAHEKQMLIDLVRSEAPEEFMEVAKNNCLLSSNQNFYDLMHYKPIVARSVINSLYGNKHLNTGCDHPKK